MSRYTHLTQFTIPRALERVGTANSLFRGDVYDRWNNATVRYPSVCYDLVQAEVEGGVTRYTVRFWAADRLAEDGHGYDGSLVGLPLTPAVTDSWSGAEWKLVNLNYITSGLGYGDCVRALSAEDYDAGFTGLLIPLSVPIPAKPVVGTSLTLPIVDYLPPTTTDAGGNRINIMDAIIEAQNIYGYNSPYVGLLIAPRENNAAYDEVTFNAIEGYMPILLLNTSDGIHYRVENIEFNADLVAEMADDKQYYGYVVVKSNYPLTTVYPGLSAFNPMPGNIAFGMRPTQPSDTYALDTCEALCKGLLAQLQHDPDVLSAELTTLNPFEQKFADNLVGYWTDITLEVKTDINAC